MSLFSTNSTSQGLNETSAANSTMYTLYDNGTWSTNDTMPANSSSAYNDTMPANSSSAYNDTMLNRADSQFSKYMNVTTEVIARSYSNMTDYTWEIRDLTKLYDDNMAASDLDGLKERMANSSEKLTQEVFDFTQYVLCGSDWSS